MDSQQIQEVITKQWNKKSISIDWLTLENCVRDTLWEYEKGKITSETSLTLIDNIFAAFTRRGNVLS